MSRDISRKKQNKVNRQHNPLIVDIQRDKFSTPRVDENVDENFEDEEMNVIPPSLSRKLLQEVKEQQMEVNSDGNNNFLLNSNVKPKINFLDDESEEFSQDDSYVEQIIDVDPEEELVMKLFMSESNPTKKTISDLIMEKIKEKELQMQNPVALESRLDSKIVTVYSQVGQILSRYTSGRLPKAAKIIPVLSNWEEILYLTQPDKWSSQAVRCMTKIFASNLQEKMAQKFYSLVLLPHFREDLSKNKKLNWHLYMALKKSLYKPKAFYKGILIPLCESGDCSLREATILGSVIKKVSIPVLQSSVALMKVALMPYSGSNSMFIKVLIDKKYALPIRVIDALIEHFLKFKTETRTLPVLWHQSLLSFAERYKTEITQEQKTHLKYLLRVHCHPKITPEIRRELFQSKCRGDTDMIAEEDNMDTIQHED